MDNSVDRADQVLDPHGQQRRRRPQGRGWAGPPAGSGHSGGWTGHSPYSLCSRKYVSAVTGEVSRSVSNYESFMYICISISVLVLFFLVRYFKTVSILGLGFSISRYNQYRVQCAYLNAA